MSSHVGQRIVWFVALSLLLVPRRRLCGVGG